MNHLRSELQRLYLPGPHPASEGGDQPPALIDPSGRVRALVMELTRPPSWELLGKVWQGVQLELDLPAPAIAVSGTDGLQLWFSLAAPIEVARAHGFLEALRARFLPGVEAGRLRLLPSVQETVQGPVQDRRPGGERHARLVPALQQESGNWSAFLAADLAPIFADSPWLDIPPNEEGQAGLLRGLATIEQPVFDAALKRLLPSPLPSQPTAADATATTPDRHPSLEGEPVAHAVASGEPAQFLLRVMNDEGVALALRIEAAKVLLLHTNEFGRAQND